MNDDKQNSNIKKSGLPELIAIIAGLGVIIGFFLPWLQLFGTVSGFDLVSKALKHDELGSLLLCLPLAIGIIALIVSYSKENPYYYGVPAMCVFGFILYKIFIGKNQLGISISDLKDIYKLFSGLIGIGLHFTWIGLLLLSIVCFYHENVEKTSEKDQNNDLNNKPKEEEKTE